MTRILSKKDVARVLDMKETIDILEHAFADLAAGNAVMPQRTPVAVPAYEGLALYMPAYLKGIGSMGAKIVTVYKNNPQQFNLPTIFGTIILLDEKTGAPLALMDGGFLTAMRTGGVAGLATRRLARSDARVHALFGTGGMAKPHAWAVSVARPINRLIVHSVDPPEKIRQFTESLSDVIDCQIDIADDPQDALREADIVTLITSASEPVIKAEWVQPGTHINGVGAHTPLMREIDSETVQKAIVVCDQIDACKAEAGDLIIAAEEGKWSWADARGGLGEVISGQVPGRQNDQEITLFKSVGLAIQDISTAFHVYRKAKEAGVGLDFDFG